MKKSKMKKLLKRAFIDCGTFNITPGKLPFGCGTGSFGKVKRGNVFELVTDDGNPVNIDGKLFQNRQVVRAKIDEPGNEPCNWI